VAFKLSAGFFVQISRVGMWPLTACVGGSVRHILLEEADWMVYVVRITP
jgi:hypothetical protein